MTTVRKLLDGTYQYWIELDEPSPAKDLTVTLRHTNGSRVRSWTSPANLSAQQVAWHVFDIDGKTGSVTSVDQVINSELPEVREPNTYVCPKV
ncbi:MAG: hypothetical protein U0031_05945 [Thermomicrobiales bacterium]